jgi:hypothetical protein
VSALFLYEPDFAAKLANRPRFESPAASATQRREQALRISRGAEKVSRRVAFTDGANALH